MNLTALRAARYPDRYAACTTPGGKMSVPRRLAMATVCAALVVTSCAPVPQQRQEGRLPPGRMSQRGYSFVPPAEQGWLVARRTPVELALGRRGTNPDETFAIRGDLITLPAFVTSDELVRLVKDGQAKDTDPRRFNVMRHAVAAEKVGDANCAKSHAVAEDRSPVKRSGQNGPMVLEMLTLTCAQRQAL
jgi:hypothetical protein